MTLTRLLTGAAAAALLAGAAQAEIRIGHLADYSGATSDIGVPFGQGVADAFAWVNEQGGVAGEKLAVDTQDYGYQVPRAISLYKQWTGGRDPVVAIMGWGTADTEALLGFVAQDEIPYMSGSYSAALTDPQGVSGKTKPAPYNFFYGPSYSDSLRAMLTWAAEDWKARGMEGQPSFVHMGANHPYPMSPREAGQETAKELGFEVLPDVQFALTPGDYTAQCLTLKDAGADYAYLGNTAGSNISILNACDTVGAEVTFLGNVWGMGEDAAKAAGQAADGVIFPLRTDAVWGADAPGMETVRAVSAMSNADAPYRSVHYLAGVCTAMYMAEAIKIAAEQGEVTGPAIRDAFYAREGWVPEGFEGVCMPSTWTPEDHRGMMAVPLYRTNVSGSTEAPLPELMENDVITLEPVDTIELERRADQLGY